MNVKLMAVAGIAVAAVALQCEGGPGEGNSQAVVVWHSDACCKITISDKAGEKDLDVTRYQWEHCLKGYNWPQCGMAGQK